MHFYELCEDLNANATNKMQTCMQGLSIWCSSQFSFRLHVQRMQGRNVAIIVCAKHATRISQQLVIQHARKSTMFNTTHNKVHNLHRTGNVHIFFLKYCGTELCLTRENTTIPTQHDAAMNARFKFHLTFQPVFVSALISAA